MHGWSLDDVRNLDEEDYNEIVLWLDEQARADSGEPSVDMDALISARRGKG